MHTATQYTRTYKKYTGYHSAQLQKQTGSHNAQRHTARIRQCTKTYRQDYTMLQNIQRGLHNAPKHTARIRQCTKTCTVPSITQCIQAKRVTSNHAMYQIQTKIQWIPQFTHTYEIHMTTQCTNKGTQEHTKHQSIQKYTGSHSANIHTHAHLHTAVLYL